MLEDGGGGVSLLHYIVYITLHWSYQHKRRLPTETFQRQYWFLSAHPEFTIILSHLHSGWIDNTLFCIASTIIHLPLPSYCSKETTKSMAPKITSFLPTHPWHHKDTKDNCQSYLGKLFTHRIVVIGKEARIMIEREFLKDRFCAKSKGIKSLVREERYKVYWISNSCKSFNASIPWLPPLPSTCLVHCEQYMIAR